MQNQVSILLLCVLLPAQSIAEPRVQTGGRLFDFGTVTQGAPVSITTVIENSGSEPLLVERVEFSMPGMNARVRQRIEPGEAAEIRLTWDTSGLRRDVDGRAILHLNDPAMPELVFTLGGFVQPAIEFLPKPAFYFSQFTGESLSQSITLKNNQDRPLLIESLASSSQHFDYRITEIEQGKAFALSVSTRQDTPVGRFRDSLFIRTSDPGYANIHVEVNILVKPDVYVSTDAIEFGEVSLNLLKHHPEALNFLRQTFVINRRHGEMKITAAKSDLGFLRITIEPMKSSDAFTVVVELIAEQLRPGNFMGSLTLKTDDPEFPKLQLPVAIQITD